MKMKFYKEEDVLDTVRYAIAAFMGTSYRRELSDKSRQACIDKLKDVLSDLKRLKVYEYEEGQG